MRSAAPSPHFRLADAHGLNSCSTNSRSVNALGFLASMTASGAPCWSASANLARAFVRAASTVTPGHLPMARSRFRAHVTFQDFTPEGSTRRDKPGTLASWRRYAAVLGLAFSTSLAVSAARCFGDIFPPCQQDASKTHHIAKSRKG